MAPADTGPEAVDWQGVTFEGNRRLQQEEFRALSFRDKLKVIEQLALVTEHFARRRTARGSAPAAPPPPAAGGGLTQGDERSITGLCSFRESSTIIPDIDSERT